MMITIKELSKDLGISKVGLNKWIERNGYKDSLQKIGNKFVIPDDIEQAIRANFEHREQKTDKSVTASDNSDNAVTSELLALLREQLEVKDREIERLHSQIEQLQKINADTVKALRESNTLQAMQLSDGADYDSADEQTVNSEQTKGEAREKLSLWQRIRRSF